MIGGGVSDAGDLLIQPAVTAYRRTLTGRGYRPEARIVRAHLGNEAGLVGAADLARTNRRRSRRRSGSRKRREYRPLFGSTWTTAAGSRPRE